MPQECRKTFLDQGRFAAPGKLDIMGARGASEGTDTRSSPRSSEAPDFGRFRDRRGGSEMLTQGSATVPSALAQG